MPATFTLKCFSCGTLYRVAKSNSAQRQVDMLAARPRCINVTGQTFGTAHSARLHAGQICGAPLGVGTVQLTGHPEPGRIREVTLLAICTTDTISRTELSALRNQAMTAQDAQAEADKLRAELEALKATDAQAEIARLKTKYETACPGMAKVYGPDGEHFDLQHCGGFMGHAGECAPVW